MTYGLIYKITNKENGKVYVGQTTRSLRKRWSEHCFGSGCGIKLKSAIKKYGPDKFEIVALSYAESLDELNKKEIEYIEKFNSVELGYNLELGGRNHIASDETRKKMSESQKRLWSSTEHREKMKRRRTTDDTRSMLSAIKRNVPKSESTKKNMRKAALRRSKEVVQITGENRRVWTSTSEAARVLGLNRGNIFSCLKGRIKTAYGSKWVYSV